jgi:hypothetical protein
MIPELLGSPCSHYHTLEYSAKNVNSESLKAFRGAHTNLIIMTVP